MNKKWTLPAGLAVVAVIFLLLWHFAPAIQRWLADVFLQILMLLATFVAGWLFGRFGGKRHRNSEKENARNITEAQR